MPDRSARTTGRTGRDGRGAPGLVAAMDGSFHWMSGTVNSLQAASAVSFRSVIRRPSVPWTLNMNASAPAATGT